MWHKQNHRKFYTFVKETESELIGIIEFKDWAMEKFCDASWTLKTRNIWASQLYVAMLS